MALEFIRVLKVAGYTVKRIGLDFSVKNNTSGFCKTVNITELKDIAEKTKQVIL